MPNHTPRETEEREASLESGETERDRREREACERRPEGERESDAVGGEERATFWGDT
jgi:hypothetical protein